MKLIVFAVGAVALFLVVRFVRALGDIHVCARTGRTDKITELLAKNPDLLHETNSEGELPVHQAAKYGELGALKLLLDKGSDLNAKTPQGVTPLHLAAAFGELASVKVLLERGSAPDPKDESGMTPIMAAQAGSHDEIIKSLKAAGADDTAHAPIGQMAGSHFVAPISDADPLMLKATEKARSTVDSLRALFKERPRDTMVKIPFKTDSGDTEHLWGDLLELTSDRIKLRIKTPPATQKGKFDRVQERPLSDLEDWQVEQRDGSIRGAFGYQVVFLRTKEQLGKLPEQLAEHEKRFVDHDVDALVREASLSTPP
jgi:hypothetical protein